eukprot:CAMPEP_0172502714 /NCGR_PEP_ID=MMETSP1066-20121228/162193_1 /TAXON_ID=671091 /ORGANISM="Coscinodiscus wailesii, Strain CCMP2513" /LENGTH=153 /DNA_ID=CAMNT_0013278069 /DNA_START=452 /DNA_END=909 /DNA_ORIENTATION=+
MGQSSSTSSVTDGSSPAPPPSSGSRYQKPGSSHSPRRTGASQPTSSPPYNTTKSPGGGPSPHTHHRPRHDGHANSTGVTSTGGSSRGLSAVAAPFPFPHKPYLASLCPLPAIASYIPPSKIRSLAKSYRRCAVLLVSHSRTPDEDASSSSSSS